MAQGYGRICPFMSKVVVGQKVGSIVTHRMKRIKCQGSRCALWDDLNGKIGRCGMGDGDHFPDPAHNE